MEIGFKNWKFEKSKMALTEYQIQGKGVLVLINERFEKIKS